MNQTRLRLAVFLAIIFFSTVATVVIAPRPIPQDQGYHHFADTRSFLGVPNFANVVSNVAFILAAGAGLAKLRRMSSVTLSVGILLTGVFSAVYHWKPSDQMLALDRLGMVIVFAAFITLLMEHFGIPGFRLALPILVVFGISTILYWIYLGDLRPYGALQGFPIILFVVGSALFPRMHTQHAMLWFAAVGFVLAKICEFLDQKIFAMTGGVVSGHTLKHLLAGGALWITIEWLKRRDFTRSSS